MKWILAGWVALILLVGGVVLAMTAGKPSPQEEEAAKKAAAERAKRPPAELSDAKLVASRLEELRGLEFQGPVPKVEVVPAQQVEQQLTQLDSTAEQKQDERDKALAAASGLVLSQAGAVSAKDAQQLTKQNAGSGVLAAYLPEQGKVLIDKQTAQSDPRVAEQLLAYELTRALEASQSEEPARRPRPFRDDEAARLAVYQGSAAVTSNEYAVRYLGASEPVEPEVADLNERGADPSAPPVLQLLGAFPARAGSQFVEQIHADGGFEAVDRVVGEPPTTTREVLHPESGEGTASPTISFDVKSALGRGWQRLATGEVGELDTAAMLADGAGEPQARRAADGWRAGRFEVWAQGKPTTAQSCPPPCRKKSTSIVEWSWADETEAQEFERAVRRSLQRGSGAARPEGDAGFTIEDGGAAVVRDGASTALAFAPDARVAERVARAALEG